jgi:hypothetical protein
MKPRLMRCVVIALVSAGGPAIGGVSQAATVDGVTVPNAVLTAGTGNRVVDITISAGSPVVGSADQLAPATEDGYAVGITAAGAGGVCTAFSSASWSCEPGASGWRAGSIQLTISTAKSTACCGTLPLTLQIIGAGSPVDVDGSILIAAAPSASAPPAKAPTTAPKTQSPRSSNAPATKQPAKQADQQVSPVATALRPTASTPRPTATAATESSSPSTAVTVSGAAASAAPSHPNAVDAADASSSSSPWILGGVALAVILLAGGFMGWRWKMSRQRD